MIFLDDITQAVNECLVTAFPKPYVIYREMEPQGFKRPSLYIDPLEFTAKPANISMLEVTAAVSIVCFPETDEHGVSKNSDLAEMQEKVLSLFHATALPVKDRHLTIHAASGEIFNDAASVVIETTYLTEKEEDSGEPEYEIMENISIKIRSDYNGTSKH